MNQLCMEFFRRSDFPQEAIAAVTIAKETLSSVTDLTDYRYRFFRGDETVWEDLHIAAQEVGLHPFTADLLLLLSCLPEAKLLYEQDGISEEIYWDSMKDIRYKMTETHCVYGIWGVYCGPWLGLFLHHKCVCLGRLQFEVMPSHCACTIAGHHLRKGDPVLNLHIPSFGKLLHEDVLDAYARAEHYFRDIFPDQPAWVQVETWILYPPTLALLPEGNLRTWAEDFQIAHSCIDPKQDDRYRIFQLPPNVPIREYPEKNQLQRSLKTWLLDGNQMGIGFGYLLVKDGKLIY